MSKRLVTLDDKYALENGQVFLSGIQALVRAPLDRQRLDAKLGHSTAGFISGYRGSPLGGYDQQLRRAQKFLDAHNIHFQEGVNEDLGATAVWGSQQVGLFPGAKFDGVFGAWYGKAPGVDRTGDVFKHANFAGTSPHGGVIAIAGDDHACKSSTLPSQSEFAFADAEIPVLNPSSVQEVLDYAIYGWAMSRYSGAWAGLIALADTMDSGAVVDVGVDRYDIKTPQDFVLPEEGVSIRLADNPIAKEARLRQFKLPAAKAFVRANALDRVMLGSARPRLGVVATGQAVRDVFEALYALGLSPEAAADAGVCVYKVAMPWPLEQEGLRAFAKECETLLVIEHKRALIETQARDALYSLEKRPRIVGKRDENGAPLLSELGALSIPEIASAIHQFLPQEARTETAKAYFERVEQSMLTAHRLEANVHRAPHFCAGCPHNTSTVVPEGSRAMAGIGCHYMATFMGRADMTSQMGGEGVAWVGQAPFTDEDHVFVNMGDGTYSHSGSLAIRAAVAAKANVTYKILYNDAVAMTGGQHVESGQTVGGLVSNLRGEGVEEIVVVSDDPDHRRSLGGFGAGIDIFDRDELGAIQRRLRKQKGVSVIIYDQVCATEKRRRIKRGKMPPSRTRAFINTAVCEGCGDCSVKSNCLAVEPVATEFGIKRQINQSTCNQDLSCVNGFCPSFVTVEGASNAQRARPAEPIDVKGLAAPEHPQLDRAWNILFTGVGGAGVTTVAAILAMAAHIDGLAASTLDMTGLAQKGGPVKSHIRIAKNAEDIRSGRTPTAGADVLIGGDLIVSDSPDALELFDASRTRAVVNSDLTPTSEFIFNRDTKFESRGLLKRVEEATKSLEAVHADALSDRYFGDEMFSNMVLFGFAWGRGLVPLTDEAVEQAITLNGVAVKQNIDAFRLGRMAAQAPERLAKLQDDTPPLKTLDEVIATRVTMLRDYQDEAYAQRYADAIAYVRAKEKEAGQGEELTHAAAINLAKLMAYKDEYEVARLYTNGDWRRAMNETFTGDYKLRFHLAPPLLAPKDKVTGAPKKIAFGAWMLPAFKVLARMKGLRGTNWDMFGATDERRAERALRDEYEQKLRKLADQLTSANHGLAVAIASIPDRIRGYGHVKAKAMEEARAAEASLWSAYEAVGGEAAPEVVAAE